MSLFPIFKIYKLSDKNVTDTIYVFYGSRFSELKENPNDLFDDEPTNKVFNDVFNKEELNNIKKNKIEVIFIDQSIHIDDSIGVIKLKIFDIIQKDSSMSEIYLFCLKTEKLNPITVYQNLTQNDKLPLTKIRMDQLILNLYDEDGDQMKFNINEKMQYTFDDILKLDLTDKSYLVGKPLGQKFVFSNEYPFIADPYLVTEYDALLEKSRREISTLSSNLLLEAGPIFRNTIYLCLAKDVFEVAEKNKISSEYTSKIYFPFLYEKQIENIEVLDTKRNKLIEETNDFLTPETERNFENINMFYNIYQKSNKSDIFSQNMSQTGIKFFKISIYPEFKIKIPIDVIFKLIHATQEFPLIKYNAETRQENIYRLFAPELTVDGRKIPYLQKSVILKVMRSIGKHKSASIYTNIQYNGQNFHMACEFEDNGIITIYPLTDFDKPILLTNTQNMFEHIDEIIKITVNPLIEQIKPFFEQSGLEIPLFNSIQNINIEVRDMKYQLLYNISRPIDIDKFGGCITSVFTVESSNFKKGIRMRYKRVSNYNKRDSQDAFIIEKIDQGYKIDEIIQQLLEQFNDLNEESAEDLISKIRSELEVIRGGVKKRALMIKINPGFQTLMTFNSITSELTIEISGINDIYYLNTIPIYIDSIIRITQDKNNCGIDTKKINTLCSGKEIDDIVFGQITAQSEQTLDDNEVPNIENETPKYSDDYGEEPGEHMDDLLDILGFDEDEDEDIDIKGGKGSDSEEVSSPEVSEETVETLSSLEVPEETVESDKSLSSLPEETVESDKSLSSLEVPEETVESDKSLSSLPEETVESDKSLSSLPEETVESDKSLSSLEVPEEKVESDKSLSSLPEETVESDKSLSSLPEETVESDKSLSSLEVPEETVESDKSLKENVESDKSLKEKVETDKSLSKSDSISSIKKKVHLTDKDKEAKMIDVFGENYDENSTPVIKDKSPEDIKSPEKIELTEQEEEQEQEEEVFEIIQNKKKKTKPNNKIKEQVEQLENTVRDITGMKLQYPNPFSARLEERMPQLFVKSKNDKIDLYTRMCPFSLSERRQPVILTKQEKDKMIQEHPDDINEESDFIEYGTDPKDSTKKFYYTCPKYWCLLTDTMVTEQDILDGKCGPKVKNVNDAIIPRTSDTVPKGKYVYQFYEDDEKKYPGFHKKKMPSGLCIPCCYSNWKTPAIKNRRDICQGKFDKNKSEKTVSEEEEKIEEQIEKTIVELEYYVKGPEKYGPQLGDHRWGFLPIAVQKFLHEVNEECQTSKTNMSLKHHHMCILRHGVEDSSTQSFIACIASAIFYAQKYDNKTLLIQKIIPNAKTDVPTIKQMKEIIINAIDLDNFIKYQNGDLITSFADPDLKVDIELYKNTELYKKMMILKKKNIKKSIKEQENVTSSIIVNEQFIIRVVQAFEKFKMFLKDNKITIDYTYLWDLICIPNKNLFEAGINLIILEIPENDTTNNIELVCPTNHYSINTFDSRKRSLILVKRENYFEPIYGYHNDGKIINITKTFSEYDKKLPKTLRAVFSKIIKPTLGEKCRVFDDSGRIYPSQPKEYRFKQAPVLDKLIEELKNKKYTISFQVLNFQGKVIGLMTKNKKGLEGFVPCYPSALTNLQDKKCKKSNDTNDTNNKCGYDFVYMNDDIWKPYEQTLNFLKEYYNYEEPKDITDANCFNPKYFCRVVEHELITGFLTNTDQFVPIREPIPVSNVDDSIKTITNNDMLVADINTLVNNSVDSKRVDFIKRIQLESNFYNVFRNTIRILFNDYLNSEKRKIIKDECYKKYSLYRNKLEKVIELLQDLVKDTVIFATDSTLDYNYKDIDEKEIHTCISKTNDKCLDLKGNSDQKSSICRITKDKCQLVLPKTNLVNGRDNESFYYGRMADELIRYNRIKSFIFKPQAYLSFGQVKYNLRDDEIIILQDLLTQDFFDNLIPSEINSYAKHNTYNTAEPIISREYNKEKELDDIINPYHDRDCIKTIKDEIKSGFWKKCFPSDYKVIEYTGSTYCSLYLIIDLVEKINNKVLTVEQVKDDLLEIYSVLTDKFKDEERINKIIDVLREEAQFDANQLQDGSITFEQMIMHEGFVAINFDLWLLLVNYKIPSIFISSKPIPETRFNSNEFVCYTEPDVTKYVFILTPAMYRRKTTLLPEYKLIIDGEKIDIDISILEETNCFNNIENSIINYITIEDYLDLIFEKDITTKYKPRQKGIRQVIDFEIASNPEEVIELGEEQLEIEPIKKMRKLKVKKIKPTLILEEAEEAIDVPEEKPVKIEEIIFPEEDIEIVPVKKRKTRKQREKKLKVNPPGKKVTRRKLPENIEIVGEIEEIN